MKLPWRKPDGEHTNLQPMRVEEFFNEEGSFVRGAVLTGLIATLVLLVGNSYVIVSEWSVTSHRCDDIYMVMPLCVWNASVYSFMLLVYFTVANQRWFRGCMWLSLALLLLSTFTWCLIWTSMARICQEFYHIKYPFLQNIFRVTGIANCVICMALTVYTCGTSCFGDGGDDTGGDPLMLANVFYKKDPSWGNLFQKEGVEKYTTGVSKWSESATKRLSQLKATLDKASEVQDEATEQSNMLRQVTDELKNFDAKVNKTVDLIKDQEELITDFRLDVDNVASKLDSMKVDDIKNVPLSMMTYSDCGKWTCIFLGVLLIYGCLSFAAEKWAAMFGFTLPEWHAPRL